MQQIWQWIKSYFTAKPVSATSTTSVDIVPGSSYADAVKEVATVADDTIKTLNSPQEVRGRLNVAEQKIRDQDASDVDSAIKTGDNRKLDEDLS